MKLSVYLLMGCLLLFRSQSAAQETMMGDVNYTFLNRLIDTAKANYPKIHFYNHKTTVSELNVQKAKLSWFDVVSLSLIYSPNNSTSLVNPIFSGYQAGINVNVGSVITKPTQIKQAKEELAVTKTEKEEFLLQLESLVKQRYFTYIQKVVVLQSLASNVLDVESVVKDARYRFEKAEIKFSEYNETLVALSEAKQNKIAAEGEMTVAKAALEERVGTPLEAFK